jgi:type II secretory pathway pseudopilin PulG
VFDWLFEGRTSGYVILAALVVFLLLVWWQMRKRWLLVGVVAAAVSIGLYALLDKAVETDREQVARKIQEMAAAANGRDAPALLRNISDNFRSPRGWTKQRLGDAINGYLQSGMIERVVVWEIDCEDAPTRQRPPARVFFRAKAEGGGREFLADCEATFDFDEMHGWRLSGIRLFKPQTNEEWPWQL